MFKDKVDLTLKILSIAAIIITGIWAFYQFELFDTDASNIQLDITTEIFNYSADIKMLVIHIKPKNIGKVDVTPGHDGMILTVSKFPDNLKSGAVDLSKLPEMYKQDIIKSYNNGYELEPGVQYDEVVTLLVHKETTYSIKAVLDLGDNTEIDQTNITQVN